MTTVDLRKLTSLALLCTVVGSTAYAQHLDVIGGPTYDAATETGFQYSTVTGVNRSGTAIGIATKYDFGEEFGQRAVRWDASGDVVELGHLGDNGTGVTQAEATAINDAGTIFGIAMKFIAEQDIGYHVVRWDANSTIATELGHLPGYETGYSGGSVGDINAAGIAVGHESKFDSGSNLGFRATRWDVNGVATELGSLGLRNDGYALVFADAVNSAGVVTGYADQYVSGVYKGERAVRWDATDTTAIELGHLGLRADGFSYVRASDLNDTGTTIGTAEKYEAGSYRGRRAVRWDANSTTPIELGYLGDNGAGFAEAYAHSINAAGTAIGAGSRYVSGTYMGTSAIRWDAGGTSATELAHLVEGVTDAFAIGLNDAGTVVGYETADGGHRAVVWLPDASVIDLNTLIEPDAGWTLREATAISADGWIVGTGGYDPDGDGELEAYDRAWLMQVGFGGQWTSAISGTLDGTWGRGEQWSSGTPAMQVGSAVFDQSAVYTVTLDRDERTQSVEISAGVVTIEFDGWTLTANDGISIAGGVLQGSGVIIGDVMQYNGTLAAGNSPGTLAIEGGYSLLAGTLEVELASSGGDAGTDFDFYNISGEAVLSGNLQILAYEGYLPTDGDTFNVLTAASIDAAGLSLTGLSGFSYSIISGGNGDVLQLQFAAPIPEPSGAVILLLGLAIFPRLRRGLRAADRR